MPLGQIERATYISVRDGRLVAKDDAGKEQTYDYLEGRLVDLTTRQKEFGGEHVTQLLFEFRDDGGERFILSTGEKSGVARALLNSFASIESAAGTLRVVPYEKDGFSKVVAYHNGERLDWKYKELPPLEDKGQGSKDDSKRAAFFRQIADEIKSRVTSVSLVNTVNR